MVHLHCRAYANPERGHGPLLLTKTDVNRLEKQKADSCEKDDVEKFKECLEEKLTKIVGYLFFD